MAARLLSPGEVSALGLDRLRDVLAAIPSAEVIADAPQQIALDGEPVLVEPSAVSRAIMALAFPSKPKRMRRR